MTRRPDIDLWRGLGCLAMVISHPLRVQTAYHEAGGPAMPLLAQNIVYDIDFGAVVFFAAAGANVWNFTAKRGASAPGMARFFVIQSVLLFGLGLSYNLALGTLHLGVPDIFQGIALGTLLAYGLVRVGAPLWMVMVVVVAVFGVSGGAHDAVPSTPEGFERLGPIPRFLFAHFSFFPWAGYVAMGLLIEQAASRRAQWSVGLLFSRCFYTARS
ncbi:MAG: heparan-alpha-glucosaminide N-acetyltransferase domain-containing protein [Deltaproteobacteria bacterium]|nr:heparan-alpha-glucosaminide N-acetyltransferase domain-containing protein [Deltaproteobacteria bacterium]